MPARGAQHGGRLACPAGSIKPACTVPFREFDDGAVGIADVELAAYEDAFLAVFFLEHLESFGGKEGLRPFIFLRVDLVRVACSAAVLWIALLRCVASWPNCVISSR